MAVAVKGRQRSGGNTCLKALFWTFLILLWLGGLGCLCVGLWMNTDPYVKAYFQVLRRSVTDNTLFSASVIVLFCGLVICGVGFMGCFGMMRKSRLLLGFFSASLVLIMILELCVGFLIVVFEDDIHRTVKQGMKDNIKFEYEFENGIGRAWNFVQVREKCCGADSSYDYHKSNWWNGQNPGANDITDATVHVPKTCCVLQFDQDRDVRQVDPQDPRPRDPKRCQEDAAGQKDGSQYLHGRGCFARLLDFIYMHLNTLIGLGLAVGFLQIIGLTLGCIMFRTMPSN